MKKGVHYEKPYAPVGSCNSIRFLLKLLSVHKWKTVQLDCVLEFLQSTVGKDIHMNTPKGFKLDSEGKFKNDVLKFHKNMY